MNTMDKLVDLRYALRTKRITIKEDLFGTPTWLKPTCLQLDTQTACSLKCDYCNPQNCFLQEKNFLGQKKGGKMEMSVIDRVLETLRKEKVFINYARPFMNGDPLLEPRLYTITQKIKDALGCRIDVFTNGVEYKNRMILKNPYLNDIRFTISASYWVLYQKVHGRNRFADAVRTLKWVDENKKWYQRIWVNFVLYDKNAHDLPYWRKMFAKYRQDVRPLHEGGDREKSGNLDDFAEELARRREEAKRQLIAQNRPCNCFANMSISYEGKLLQCCDVSYEHNWGHVEEIDLMETWNKRLDMGLNHKGCQNCSQRNPNWKELFERYVWS